MRTSIILLVSIIFNNTYAQSYEGTIEDTYFIWMDLSSPNTNGQISGSYFYKNKFTPILLVGKKTSDKIVLEERNKSNIVTGRFSLTDYGDSLWGEWKNPTGTKHFYVKVYKTNPIYKPQEKIDMGYCNVDSSDGYVTTTSKRLVFARKGILTYCYCTSTEGGAYPTGECSYSTDAVNIWEEIDENKVPALKTILNNHIQDCLNDIKKRNSPCFTNMIDSTNTWDSIFTWKDDGSREISSFHYIDNDGLKFYYYDYFHFPHVCLADELSCEIIIPFNKLKEYLKPTSVLMRFVEK
jgi:hypothetical protein